MATPKVSAAVCILAFLAPIAMMAQSVNDSVDPARIASLIKTITSKDRSQIVQLIDYPFGRGYPVYSIDSSADCLKRFDEVFDESLLSDIARSDPKRDWERVGSRGIMLGNGKVWLNEDYKIFAINHETRVEKSLRASLIIRQKAHLPPSLRDFDKPVLEWETPHLLIRVDLKGDDFRLAVFKDYSYAKPLHVLLHGQKQFDGTGGAYSISWEAAGRTYRVYIDTTYGDYYYYEYEGPVGPPGLEDRQPTIEEHGYAQIK